MEYHQYVNKAQWNIDLLKRKISKRNSSINNLKAQIEAKELHVSEETHKALLLQLEEMANEKKAPQTKSSSWRKKNSKPSIKLVILLRKCKSSKRNYAQMTATSASSQHTRHSTAQAPNERHSTAAVPAATTFSSTINTRISVLFNETANMT